MTSIAARRCSPMRAYTYRSSIALEVLLHEAARGLNTRRCLKETSRGGRYHNARFKATAVEVGLVVEQPPHTAGRRRP